VPEPTLHKSWPRPWTWAIVLAVLHFGAHATMRWWFPALVQALFDDIPPTSADVLPLAWAILGCWVILSLAWGLVIGSLVAERSSVRDRYRWQHEQALQGQLRELEQQIWEESLPDSQREAIRELQQREAEIRREARRRLGLPEEGA
jgi:hypothetical protein